MTIEKSGTVEVGFSGDSGRYWGWRNVQAVCMKADPRTKLYCLLILYDPLAEVSCVGHRSFALLLINQAGIELKPELEIHKTFLIT